jgi:hypothetical protein
MEGCRALTYKAQFPSETPFILKQDRILKMYQLVKPFKVQIPTRQDWNTPQ